jgi:hypothetical protein
MGQGTRTMVTPGSVPVRALVDLAVERGCYGMWVLTDDDNPAAVRAYTAAGGQLGPHPRSIEWRLDRATHPGG